MKRKLFITGGLGFIGSCFIKQRIDKGDQVINLDCLTYAGKKQNLGETFFSPQHTFIKGDIRDSDLVSEIFNQHNPDALINFAAETHVDRSIQSSNIFVDTNVQGTERLLSCALNWWLWKSHKRKDFRFIQISTDEVYGPLSSGGTAFTEDSPLLPSNPYAASKAAADLLVNSYYKTYGLPTVITRSSNNYGHNQNTEKLIPLLIKNASRREPLPIYGDGKNQRSWIFVDDCCSAISCVLEKGRVGETYNIGGGTEKSNIEIAQEICNFFNQLMPMADGKKYQELITFVDDRPGHDFRYCLDCSKFSKEMGHLPTKEFKQGLFETICWYMENVQLLDKQ